MFLEHEKAVREKSEAATGALPALPDDETRDMVQAIGDAAASSTKLNPAQKRFLSNSFEDQDYRKSQRMSNEDTAALLPFAGDSENEMKVKEEGGDV